MLVFTPALCAPVDPLRALEAALPHVDVVQVRPKPLGKSGPAAAREAYELCLAVLDLTARAARAPLVVVDDRVDVARALWGRGLAGVHLGQEDTPPADARRVLGPEPLVGLSTHALEQVARAGEEPVEYVGFGPIHATATKGVERGLGPELAWVASGAAPGPLFPIGGIDATNVNELARIGRAAVAAAILSAPDPGNAAALLRDALEGGD